MKKAKKNPKERATTNSRDIRDRRCIVSREVLPETDLIRFVADPEGKIVPDLLAKLPGRGLWVRADRDAVDTASERGGFARAAKAQITAPSDLAGQVEAGLIARIGNFLGLAARAGEITFGFDSVREALRSGAVGFLIEAADGAADGREKVLALAHGLGAKIPVLGAFESSELDLALGRTNVIHAAVRPGPLAEKLGFEAGRLKGFRPLCPADWRLPGGELNDENCERFA